MSTPQYISSKSALQKHQFRPDGRTYLQISACEPNRCVSAALAQCVSHGQSQEEDLFLARAVLQLLAASPPHKLQQRLADAHDLLEAYEVMRHHALPDSPLVHLVHLLLQVSCVLLMLTFGITPQTAMVQCPWPPRRIKTTTAALGRCPRPAGDL